MSGEETGERRLEVMASEEMTPGEMTLEYRKAVKEDASQITGLVQETIKTVYPKYYPKEVVGFFCELHSQEAVGEDINDGNTWILYEGQRPAGTGSLRGDHITRVYVHPDFQGKGYGSFIVRKLEEEIFSKHDRVFLDASLPACRLYEALGYKTLRHDKWLVENGVVLVYEIMEKGRDESGALVRTWDYRDRDGELTERLFQIWKKSVNETHLFLSEQEIGKIVGYVPEALKTVPYLMTVTDENGAPAGFMGISERKLEMLFLLPEARGKGLGHRLIRYAVENYAVNEVCVNEQNPQARGFYEHEGFKVYRRTEHDEQGAPYPLLYMKLQEP